MSHQQQTMSMSASTAMSPSSSSQLWPTIPQVWHRQRQQQRALTQLNDNRRAQDTTQKCMFFFFTLLIIFYKCSMHTDREHHTREMENYRPHWEFQSWWHPPPFPPQNALRQCFECFLLFASDDLRFLNLGTLFYYPPSFTPWQEVFSISLAAQFCILNLMFS